MQMSGSKCWDANMRTLMSQTGENEEPLSKLENSRSGSSEVLQAGTDAPESEYSKGNFSFVSVLKAANLADLQARFSICLATQTTIDRLSTIGQQASHWRGPIELVVFLRTENEIPIAQQFLNYLSTCEEWFRNTVSTQISFTTAEFNFSAQEIQIIRSSFLISTSTSHSSNLNVNYEAEIMGTAANNCSVPPEDVFRALLDQHLPEGPDPMFVYPQNHMRNHAKHSCAALYDWVTVLDVDIIPKENSAEDLQKFWQSKVAKNCKKCAFVLPVYELWKPCKFPKTKQELIEMSLNNATARPFHFGFWKPAQQATNYDKWSKKYTEEGPVQISHDANYKLSINESKHKERSYFYEPFYIAHKSIPDYEERFLGFGFTRSTQAFVALLTGWKFKVLTPSFVTQCGIQPGVKKEDFEIVPRYKQVKANTRIYMEFIDEMLMKYNDTTSWAIYMQSLS